MANNDISRIVDQDLIRSSALQSSDPFEALYRVNPELASIAYADKKNLLSPQILPTLAQFRGYQSNEKISLIRGLVDHYSNQLQAETTMYGMDRNTEVSIYQVDGNVEMNRQTELSQTERTRITEGGMTDRTRISERESTKRNLNTVGAHVKMTDIHEKNKTSRTGIRESNHTTRTQIETYGLVDMHRLKYEADVAIIQAQTDGQKYISDNELKARCFEAKANLTIIETQETLRTQTKMKLSRDKLEATVTKAAYEYATNIKNAEMLRDSNSHNNRKELITHYLNQQYDLAIKILEMEYQQVLEDDRLERISQKEKTKRQANVERTKRQAIKSAEDILIKRGKDKATISVQINDNSIVVEYSLEDKNSDEPSP
jgi:hypothetical protein